MIKPVRPPPKPEPAFKLKLVSPAVEACSEPPPAASKDQMEWEDASGQGAAVDRPFPPGPSLQEAEDERLTPAWFLHGLFG